METNRSLCKPVVIYSTQGNTPEQIPDLEKPGHDRRGIRQGIEKALAGARKSRMVLLLTAVLVAGLGVIPSMAADDCACTPCHGTLEEVHGDFNHTAAPGSGPVTLFADTDHDDAGRTGSKPYFAVVVDCTICHHTDLPAIHGNDCATCHPTPYDTLGLWNKGCQQGGCHSFYHQDATKAHLAFENSSDPNNDCTICHFWGSVEIPQSNCLNCHATYVPNDISPPVTTSNTLAVYDGPAKIDFSMTDNGKVGVGRTFYQLDGGPTTPAGKSVEVSALGAHQLDFWSKDQAGNTETNVNTVFFEIIEDTSPPTTTSNAQATYNQGGTITLTATDNSSRGVKTTYYRLNDGPIQTGTTIVLPTASGSITYTLAFWSEDWSGNVEAENTVSFTVISGTGTIRLIWGSSDMYGSPCDGDPEANAAWVIRRDRWSGPVVASGSGGCPNWSGIDDVVVPAGTMLYFVTIDWWDSGGGIDDQTVFGNVSVSTAGDIVRLNY